MTEQRYFGVWKAQIDLASGHARLELHEPEKMGEKGVGQLREWAIKTLRKDYPDVEIEVKA